MRHTALLVVAALALGGCADYRYYPPNYDWGDLTSNPREFFNLEPPVRVAGDAIAGTNVALKNGQALIVRIPEDASTGAVWRMRPLPRGAVIAPVQHDYVAKPGSDPARPDAGGEGVFRLRAVAPGTQAITLDQLRAGDATPQKTLAFDVTVR